MLEGIRIERAPRVLLDALAGERAEALIVALGAREAHHGEVRREDAVAHQVVEAGQKPAPGQVTCTTEDDKAARLRQQGFRETHHERVVGAVCIDSPPAPGIET